MIIDGRGGVDVTPLSGKFIVNDMASIAEVECVNMLEKQQNR